MAPRLALSVLIPTYNAADNLPALERRLTAGLKGLGPYEVVCVDDASGDGSARLLGAWAKRSRGRVRVLALGANGGQHAALLRGLALCRGDAIVTLDDDLQHPPECIPALLAGLTPGVDLAYGVGDGREQAWWRRLLSPPARRLLSACIPGLSPRLSGFRTMRRPAALKALAVAQGRPAPFLDGALALSGARAAWVALPLAPRAQGRSGYRLGSLVAYTWGALRSYSPLFAWARP